MADVIIEREPLDRRARALHDRAIARAITALGGRILEEGPVAGIVIGYRPLEACVIDAVGHALARVRTRVVGRDVESETIVYPRARATPWRG